MIQSPDTLAQAEQSLPAIRAILRGRPDLQMTILTPDSLIEFWQRADVANQTLSFSPETSIVRVASKIRNAGRFDAAVTFSKSLRSAVQLYLAGVPIRAGLRTPLGAFFLNQDLPQEAIETSDACYYLKLAQSVGANVNLELAQLAQHHAAQMLPG